MKKTLENIKIYVLKFLNTFFNFSNQVIVFVVKYPALITALAFLLLFSIIVLLIKNDTNVGGMLGVVWKWLNNKNNSTTTTANTIPADRAQQLGETDSQGYVQYKVAELPSFSNPFRDKTQITLPSGDKVKLPDGIKDTDIDVVIQTKSQIVVVPYDSNKIQAQDTQNVIDNAQKQDMSAQELLDKLKAMQSHA